MIDEQEASSWILRCGNCGKSDRRTRTLSRSLTLDYGKQLGWTVDSLKATCPDCTKKSA